MATSAFPLRFESEEQKQRAMTDAALHGMSLNAYVLHRLGVDNDPATAKARAAARALYARLAESREFDELDAQLAATPRSSPAQLGFDPAAYAQSAAGAA